MNIHNTKTNKEILILGFASHNIKCIIIKKIEETDYKI